MSILLVVALIAVIVVVGDIRFSPSKSPTGLVGADGVAIDPKPYLPFSLPAWAKATILFVASLAVGLIVASWLGPVLALLILLAVAFFFYYRTNAGKKRTDDLVESIKARAPAPSESPGSSSLSAALAQASAGSSAQATVTPAGAPILSPDVQFIDQLAAATRVVKGARKTLDGDLLPGLATASNESERAMIADAVRNNRATVEQGKTLAQKSIAGLVGRFSSRPDEARLSLTSALDEQTAPGDDQLKGVLTHMLTLVDVARFDEAGTRVSIEDAWVRATENPGLTNSPI